MIVIHIHLINIKYIMCTQIRISSGTAVKQHHLTLMLRFLMIKDKIIVVIDKSVRVNINSWLLVSRAIS